MIYQLKINLKHMKPPVWRRIQVDGETTFLTLHQLIQEAFDWDDAHLHEFTIKTKASEQMTFVRRDIIRIGSSDNSSVFNPILDESEEQIMDYFKNEKDKVFYTYDFGDDWEHKIELEYILSPEANVVYPRCIKARKLAPKEDSFGEWDEEELAQVDDATLLQKVNKRFQKYVTEPSRDENEISEDNTNWQELFELVDSYKKEKPWEQLFDNQIIIVDIPDVAERAYCCILGNAGEEFGLAVYLGDDGLETLQNMLNNTYDSHADLMFMQRSILLSLVNRDELEKSDYQLIKRLGLSFRGENQWPMFRSFIPGYYPWFIDQEEIHILKVVLEQVMDASKLYKTRPEQVPPFSSEQWLARLPVSGNSELTWENTFMKPTFQKQVEDVHNESFPVLIPELDLKRRRKQLNRVNMKLEFEAQFFLEPVQEEATERPYFPTVIIAVQKKEGLIVFNELLSRENYEEELQIAFLNMMEAIGGIPREISMERKDTYKILEPLLKLFSIKVLRVNNLPILSEVRKGMEEMQF